MNDALSMKIAHSLKYRKHKQDLNRTQPHTYTTHPPLYRRVSSVIIILNLSSKDFHIIILLNKIIYTSGQMFGLIKIFFMFKSLVLPRLHLYIYIYIYICIFDDNIMENYCNLNVLFSILIYLKINYFIL